MSLGTRPGQLKRGVANVTVLSGLAMKTKTIAWVLSLAVWLSLVQYGMSTARLGESESSYGVLDNSVRPFLVAR